MTRPCDSCGTPYEAKRAASRFCSSRCRVRSSRSPAKAVDAPAAPLTDPATSGLLIATTAALEAAHVLDNALGQLAIEVSLRIVNPAETGASVASLAKQLRETMTAALNTSEEVVADPLDELRRRRDRKRRV
jgi:hypothetical protein